MSRYRGPKEPFPFATHRSIGDIIAACRRGQRNSIITRYGDPAARAAKARQFRARKLALVGLTNKRIAESAGLDPAAISPILSGKKRGTWFTLGLIDDALAHEEARREASKGSGCKSQINPLPEERAGLCGRRKGAAPRLAAGGAG